MSEDPPITTNQDPQDSPNGKNNWLSGLFKRHKGKIAVGAVGLASVTGVAADALNSADTHPSQDGNSAPNAQEVKIGTALQETNVAPQISAETSSATTTAPSNVESTLDTQSNASSNDGNTEATFTPNPSQQSSSESNQHDFPEVVSPNDPRSSHGDENFGDENTELRNSEPLPTTHDGASGPLQQEANVPESTTGQNIGTPGPTS